MKSEIGVRKWCVCVCKWSESGVRKSGMWVGSGRVGSRRVGGGIVREWGVRLGSERV